MPIAQLVVASGNLGKIQEFAQALTQFDLTLIPKPDHLEVEETGSTFLANAHLKASQVAIATGKWALADDSGLAVDALKGAPGIYSARYGHSDRDRIQRVLQELGDQPNRQAQFVCAIAIANPQGELVAEAEGICHGQILHQPQGSDGFGYDPIFYLPEHQLTFGQMSPHQKAQYSHRALALAILLPQLQRLMRDSNPSQVQKI
ncbi:MAG: RdgB/HAM1 family non-canonical purine NTP pyrophosphatase [Pseudanabaenaceae cyanobacterium bins.68]|nr:RdgB/HAM1 family non-canonical purine NTP pyrophosphatase [Pseudanabaenaceae cyanobacterium bins.68]